MSLAFHILLHLLIIVLPLSSLHLYNSSCLSFFFFALHLLWPFLHFRQQLYLLLSFVFSSFLIKPSPDIFPSFKVSMHVSNSSSPSSFFLRSFSSYPYLLFLQLFSF